MKLKNQNFPILTRENGYYLKWILRFCQSSDHDEDDRMAIQLVYIHPRHIDIWIGSSYHGCRKNVSQNLIIFVG